MNGFRLPILGWLAATLTLAGMLLAGASGQAPQPEPSKRQRKGNLDEAAAPGVQPYLNMPRRYPLEPGQWVAQPAFPRLRFAAPTLVLPVPGSNRLIVLERDGVMRSFVNDPQTRETTLVLDLQAQCQGRLDSGLLGMTFHPDFGKPDRPGRGWFYICYNHSPKPVRTPEQPSEWMRTTVRLSRFTVPDGQLQADPASELVLIEQADEHLFHTGGAMFFHPDDGFLYVSLGDEGHYGGRLGNCQRLDGDLFGGVIRIDVEMDPTRSHPPPRQPKTGKTAHYGIPHDNPFVGMPGVLEEFYAHGLRSPHRMTLDPVSKRVWIGDVGDGGQNPREEINLLVKGGNYQWNYKEGSLDRPIYARKPAKLIGREQPPIYEYPHADGNRCVIGGYVYRGKRHEQALGGRYLFGDWASGRIWTLDYREDAAPIVTPLCSLPGAMRLNSFGLDHDGELLLCALEGHLFKLVQAGTPELSLEGQQPLPKLLSQTGAFRDAGKLATADGLMPYEVNVPLWSDFSEKQRWLALPHKGRIKFSPTGEWRFPAGTVFVKHFELPVDETDATARKRLETRLLVVAEDASVYGVTYKWRDDASDAELLDDRTTVPVTINTAAGSRQQVWTFPSRTDCLVCHNPVAGGVLGVNARQLNRPCGGGVLENQLQRWSRLGLFTKRLSAEELAACNRLFALDDPAASTEARARSYLDANCAYCHRVDHLQDLFDARIDTPRRQQRMLDVPAHRAVHVPDAFVVRRGNRERSALFHRLVSCDADQMPPLGRSMADPAAVAVIGAWIDELAWQERGWMTAWIGGIGLGLGVVIWMGRRAALARAAAGRRRWLLVGFMAAAGLGLIVLGIVGPLTNRDYTEVQHLAAVVNSVQGVVALYAGRRMWLRPHAAPAPDTGVHRARAA